MLLEVYQMAAIRRPNVHMWERIMLMHAPFISRYAQHRLEKWYFEDEPKLYSMNMHAGRAEPEAKNLEGASANAQH